jgi:hypothetical protein
MLAAGQDPAHRDPGPAIDLGQEANVHRWLIFPQKLSGPTAWSVFGIRARGIVR